MAIKINGVTVIADTQAITTTSTISATGNVTAGNVSVTGTITAAGVNTGSSPISTSGNVTGGNILTGGLISATGNITTSGNFVGNGAALTGLPAGYTNANLATLGSNNVSTTGTVTASSVVGGIITGSSTSVTGNITGSYIIGNGSQLTGLPAGYTNANLATLGSNNVSTTGTVTASSVVGGVITGSSTSVTGTQTAASTVGGVITGSSTSVTGTQTAASTVGGVITGSSTSVTGSQTAASTVGGVITGTSVSVSGGVTAASVAGGVSTATSYSATGAVTAASVVGGVITGSSTSVTGNVTGANLVVTTNIYDATAMAIVTGAGNINLQPAGNVVVNSKNINGVADPVQDQDVATKKYVDGFATTGIAFHSPVQAATNTTLATATGGTITYTQPNGAANGIGALLTTTGSFNLIDTSNVQTVGTRILVKNEANAVLNGVYTWANATNIVRSTDTDEYGADSTTALSVNDYFFTTAGNVNAGSAFVVNAPTGTITFGTSNITFATFSSSQVYTANTSAGQLLSGTVFSTKVDGTTTAFDGGGNISVKASATLTTPNIGAATGTSLSVTGTVTGASHVGSVVSVTGAVTAASTVGGVITGSSTSVTGTTTAASVVGGVITGSSTSVTGTTTAASVVGGVITGSSTSVTGTTTAASVVGGVITGTSVSVSGSVTGGAHNGTSVSVSGGVTAASVAGGVITGTSTSVTGSQTAASTVGGVITGSTVSATGNISGNYFIGNGSALTGISAGGGNSISNGTSSVAVASGANITFTVGGTSIAGISSAGIYNTQANGVGNIGSSTTYFNTVFAKATSAQYADLAEKYTADAEYAPGTVLVFGGTAEVTVDASDADCRVAGVVSTNPGFIMNEGLATEFAVAIALTGRVPTMVVGPVRKGDMMVAAGLGRARAEADPRVGSVIGKALEDFDGAEGTIEVVVGRF